MNQVIQITDHFHNNKICYPLPQQDSIKNWNKNINALERYGIFNVTLPILLLERYIFFAILLHKTKFACRYINVQENSTKLWCFCHIHVATLFYIFIGKICWTYMVTKIPKKSLVCGQRYVKWRAYCSIYVETPLTADFFMPMPLSSKIVNTVLKYQTFVE